MDLSGLIFVALAIAWAAYLIPKALRHHEDVARARTVDQFSDHLRVLARREPVSTKAARLVVSKTRTDGSRTTTAGAAVVETDGPAPAAATPPAATVAPARRPAGRSAARRRRRVLGLLLVLLVATAGGVVTGHLPTLTIAAPVTLLVAWLVACRLMVTGERRARTSRPIAATPVADETTEPTPDAAEVAESPVAPDAAAGAAPSTAQPAAPGLWDPLPMTLPTYVTKPKATRRTVRTIDLDDSDVWTSGRTDVDAALAREAERPPVAPEETSAARRAAGS